MSRNSYTPGPWFWESDVLCNVDFIVGGKHHQFNYRNRDLIAAAPELLDLVQRANGKNGCHTVAWQEKAKEVLAKALGQ